MNKPAFYKSLRYAAIAIGSVGISGVAAASSTTVNGTSGPDSATIIEQRMQQAIRNSNLNRVALQNQNVQDAVTGSVEAGGNTTVGGDSASGAAENANTTITDAMVDNSGSAALAAAAAGSIEPSTVSVDGVTGPGSTLAITDEQTNVFENENANVIDLSNFNAQTAASGNVSSWGNTEVGGGMSGNAGNIGGTSTTFSLAN